MHRSVRRILALGAGSLVLALLGPVALAAAAAPATVTVRVEGLNQTLLPPTQVTTTTTPVIKDGNPEHACTGTSAIGALQTATGGNWEGPWELGQYSVASILGETHPFELGAPANYFWSFWLNDREVEESGPCGVELNPGDHVLFIVECFGKECPSPAPLPLEVQAPATANVGESIPVTVKRYTSAGVGTVVSGASVVGGGSGAVTAANGNAALTFTHTGETELQVNASNSIRTEAFVCVHNGNDGTCGTTVSGAGESSKSSTITPSTSPTIGSDLAKVAGVKNDHVYPRRGAPRLLEGVVEVPAGGTLRQVRISLARRRDGRCFDFSGAREKFVRVKCGKSAQFFSVGDTESFSYLLPARLSAGTYTYNIEAVDSSGQTTKLVNGVSHVVFRVK